MLALDPDHFAAVQGSTDTEVVFHLALTNGLEDDPLGAMARTIGQIEETARRQGREPLVQGTFGISDGESLWAVRYATEGTARTLFASCRRRGACGRSTRTTSASPRLRDDDRLIVSEPFSDLPGVWEEIPQSSSVRVAADGVFERAGFPAPGRGGLSDAHPVPRPLRRRPPRRPRRPAPPRRAAEDAAIAALDAAVRSELASRAVRSLVEGPLGDVAARGRCRPQRA